MTLKFKYWLNLSLFNLLIVAVLGTLMRYKIGFEFPYFNQKNIQHGHSHFAFLGWITHAIYVLILFVLTKKKLLLNTIKYRRLIILNLFLAYAMIFSFLYGGYNFLSIILSSLAILVNYVFSYTLYKDVKQLPNLAYEKNWFLAALLFNVLSSAGTLALAYIIGTKHFNQHWYLASLYFYLHFQYNGFFSFACLGLLFAKIPEWLPGYTYKGHAFWLLFTACFPAYFLSTLWAELPFWLYGLVILAAFAQIGAWSQIISGIKKSTKLIVPSIKKGYYLFLLVAIAFTLKLFLQLGSTIPAVSKLAFGFRPIVIAYLHLILLAIISVFLLGYMYANDFISSQKTSIGSLVLFVSAVFLNEIVLAVQGIASFSYTSIPFVNEILFGVALLIMFGMLLLVLAQLKNNGLVQEWNRI